MKLLDKFIWLSAIFLFALSSLTAQEDVLRPKGKPEGYGDDFFVFSRTPFSIGLEGGLNYTIFSQDVIPTYADNTYYATVNDVDKSLSGIAPHFAIIADYAFNSQSAVQVRLGIEHRKMSNIHEGVAFNFFDQSVPAELEKTYEMSWYSFAALYRHSFTPELFATIGLYSEFLHEPGTEEITLRTLDGTPVSSIKSGWTSSTDEETVKGDVLAESYENSRTAIEIGVGYKFKLADRWSLVPQARFQYFLSRITDNGTFVDGNLGTITYKDATLDGLQFALALWFNL